MAVGEITRQGFGIHLMENGHHYRGHWKNDKYDGKGKLTISEEQYSDGLW